MRLPIILCEGIGDSLLLLGFIPHHSLARLGCRFNVFYVSNPEANNHYKLVRPLIQDLVAAVPHFVFQEREPTVAEKRLFQVMMRGFRRRMIYVTSAQPKSVIAWTWHFLQGILGMKSAYPTTILDDSDKLAFLRTERRGLKLLLHTHLDATFAPFKCWGAKNWVETIKLVRRLNPNVLIDVWIIEINREAVSEIKRELPDVRVLNEMLESFASLVASFPYFDLLVAVDSWTKYVGNWCGVESVIIAPSHIGKNIWRDLTAEELLNWYFNGLYHNKHIDVIGLEVVDGVGRYSLEKLDDLTPAFLADRIQGRIERIQAKEKRLRF